MSGKLRAAVEQILFKDNPIHINFRTTVDEYALEAATILQGLSGCCSVDDVQGLVHQVFSWYFDPALVGDESKYRAAAEAIWAAWQPHRLASQAN